MIILGIDPGTTHSAYVKFDTETNKILDKENQISNEELLEVLNKVDYHVMAIEMVASYGMPVGKTTFETVYWIGRFCESVYKLRDYIFYDKEIPYPEVKRLYKKVDINPTLCFSNKAKDSNIRQALLDMFESTGGGKTPQVGTKSQPGPLFGVAGHVWSALAVVFTYALQNKLINREEYK